MNATTNPDDQKPVRSGNNYFGDCPHCLMSDGYLNIGANHYNVCDVHRVFWSIGANLFSSWKEETEADWQRNKELLGQYSEVKPFHTMIRDVRWSARIENEVILRPNNCATHETCALCNCYERADSPLMAALEGTGRWVCLPCFEKRSGIPGSAQLIHYLNQFLPIGAATPDEQREAFLCNIDWAVRQPGTGTSPGNPVGAIVRLEDVDDSPL